MAREPVRLRAVVLTALAAAALIASCAATATYTAGPVHSDGQPSSPAAPDAGQVGPSGQDYVDPDQDATPLPTPEPEAPSLDDPASYGLTAQDETTAIAAAQDFVTTIWDWDYTDNTDRAGLIRALPMATAQLRQQLQPFLEDPLYDPQEWDQLHASGQVGSASEVLTAQPAPQGLFDADTYTVQVIYRTFMLASDGYYVPRQEDARYATVELNRTEHSIWLVAAIPNQDTEQVIEAGQ